MSGLATLHENARVALRTRLWSVSGIPGTGYRKIDNVELDLKGLTGKQWVRETMRVTNVGADLLGGDVGMVQSHKCSGAYLVDLFFPKGISTPTPDTLVGATLAAFAPGTTLVYADVRVLILSFSSSGPVDDKDGWYFYPLLFSWEANIVQ